VRKPSFTVRSLEFLKSHNSPWRPPPFFVLCPPPLPRDSAAVGCRCHAARGQLLLQRRSTRHPRARRRLSPSLLAFPEHSTSFCRPPELLPLCRRRSPPLTVAPVLPVLPPALVAPIRHLQAGRRSSSSPLAFLHARHAARSLPKLRPAATSRRRPPAAANARRASS
jgi:hypothetical protein